MTVYPTAPEVLSIHATPIERFGGSHGIRDRGGLESALARPQTGYYRDLIEEARGFVGEFVAESSVYRWQQAPRRHCHRGVLRVNGYRLEFDDPTAFSFPIGLYETGRMRFEELDVWLRKNVAPE